MTTTTRASVEHAIEEALETILRREKGNKACCLVLSVTITTVILQSWWVRWRGGVSYWPGDALSALEQQQCRWRIWWVCTRAFTSCARTTTWIRSRCSASACVKPSRTSVLLNVVEAEYILWGEHRLSPIRWWRRSTRSLLATKKTRSSSQKTSIRFWVSRLMKVISRRRL